MDIDIGKRNHKSYVGKVGVAKFYMLRIKILIEHEQEHSMTSDFTAAS